MCTLTKPRRGQTLIIFALISLLLMGALGLVLDAGYDFGMRRQMQNAADAAALAGVRALVANTSSPGLLATVQQVARQNGVADPTDPNQLTCTVLKNDLSDYGPCGNGTYSNGTKVSAVRVVVHENHPTFVLRALGNATSNTGATATAQVTELTTLPNNQAPFIVCGIDTQTVTIGNNGKIKLGTTQSIFNTTTTSPGVYTYTAGNGTTTTYKQTAEPPTILDSAYAFDWDSSPAPTLPNTSAGPLFLIHDASGSNGIAGCDTASGSWKGYNGSITGNIVLKDNYLQFAGNHQYYDSSGNATGTGPTYSADCPTYSSTSSNCNGTGDVQQAGQGQETGPAANVPGAGGCQAGVDPNNCVLILPIIDNSVQGLSGGGNNNYVAVRTLAAFYITAIANGNGNPNSHVGQLIKNYPIKVQGTPTFSIGSKKVLIFRLVQ